jgi:hypothetical protein
MTKQEKSQENEERLRDIAKSNALFVKDQESYLSHRQNVIDTVLGLDGNPDDVDWALGAFDESLNFAYSL